MLGLTPDPLSAGVGRRVDVAGPYGHERVTAWQDGADAQRGICGYIGEKALLLVCVLGGLIQRHEPSVQGTTARAAGGQPRDTGVRRDHASLAIGRGIAG